MVNAPHVARGPAKAGTNHQGESPRCLKGRGWKTAVEGRSCSWQTKWPWFQRCPSAPRGDGIPQGTGCSGSFARGARRPFHPAGRRRTDREALGLGWAGTRPRARAPGALRDGLFHRGQRAVSRERFRRAPGPLAPYDAFPPRFHGFPRFRPQPPAGRSEKRLLPRLWSPPMTIRAARRNTSVY